MAGKENGELGESFGKVVSAVSCFMFGMVNKGRMLILMRVGLGSAPTFASFYVIVPLYAYLSTSASLPLYCV